MTGQELQKTKNQQHDYFIIIIIIIIIITIGIPKKKFKLFKKYRIISSR